MSSPKYTVTYFGFRWLAEPIRYLLSYVGEDFKDVRVDWDAWVKGEVKKEDYPYGRLPCFEERLGGGNGTIKLSQSYAILRYLAGKYKLTGSSPLESSKCDEYADVIKDILKELELMWGADAETQTKVKSSLLTKTFPTYFSVIESELKKKKQEKVQDGKFELPLVGKDITWVDFVLAHYTDIFEQFLKEQVDLKDEKDGHPTLLDDYPTIKEHQRKVFSLEKIKVWIGKRPNTPY